MMLKCGKNKKSDTQSTAECVTDVCTSMQTWNLYIIKRQRVGHAQLI